jgi:hypothetical protein
MLSAIATAVGASARLRWLFFGVPFRYSSSLRLPSNALLPSGGWFVVG